MKINSHCFLRTTLQQLHCILIILGDPGAVSLFEGQKNPWAELTLTEPVPEILEFVPLIGHPLGLRGCGNSKINAAPQLWFQGRCLLTFPPHLRPLIEDGDFSGSALIRVNSESPFPP